MYYKWRNSLMVYLSRHKKKNGWLTIWSTAGWSVFGKSGQAQILTCSSFLSWIVFGEWGCVGTTSRIWNGLRSHIRSYNWCAPATGCFSEPAFQVWVLPLQSSRFKVQGSRFKKLQGDGNFEQPGWYGERSNLGLARRWRAAQFRWRRYRQGVLYARACEGNKCSHYLARLPTRKSRFI